MTTTTLVPLLQVGLWWSEVEPWITGLQRNAAKTERRYITPAAPQSEGGGTTGVRTPPPAAATSPSIASVMECIKRYESGDYTEQSHIWDGSGAYQYIPSTWQAWFKRWKDSGADTDGYTFIEFAYQAPPWVQDAVTAFALTNGGAGNWSMKYGVDPCTQGLPGGG